MLDFLFTCFTFKTWSLLSDIFDWWQAPLETIIKQLSLALLEMIQSTRVKNAGDNILTWSIKTFVYTNIARMHKDKFMKYIPNAIIFIRKECKNIFFSSNKTQCLKSLRIPHCLHCWHCLYVQPALHCLISGIHAALYI